MFTIYKVTNTANSLVYVGLTGVTLSQRMSSHKWEAMNDNPRKLYAAMRNIGVNQFSISAIENTDNEEAGLLLERAYVAKFDSFHNGYNETPTGSPGGPCSPEKAAKIAAAERGKPRPWQHGKPSKPSKSGHYGIEWRHDVATPKWVVRIAKRKYGAFATLDEAIARRDQVLADPSIQPARPGRPQP